MPLRAVPCRCAVLHFCIAVFALLTHNRVPSIRVVLPVFVWDWTGLLILAQTWLFDQVRGRAYLPLLAWLLALGGWLHARCHGIPLTEAMRLVRARACLLLLALWLLVLAAWLSACPSSRR